MFTKIKPGERWYIFHMQNLLIISITFGLISLHIGIYLYKTIKDLGLIASIFTIIGFIITLVVPVAAFIAKHKEKQSDEERKAKVEPVIDRSSHMKKIQDLLNKMREDAGILILFGASGSGKSTLLKELKDKSEGAYYKNNNYFENWKNEAEKETGRLVILDQFERALYYQDALHIVDEISKSKRVILGLREEYLANLHELFMNQGGEIKKSSYLHYLKLDEDDFEKLQNKFDDISGYRREESQKKQIYIKLMADIEKARLPIIVVTLIYKCIQQNGLDKVEQSWQKHKNYFDLIDSYIKKDIDSLQHPEIGYALLYLMCKDQKSENANMLSDFKNITFHKKKEIEETITELMEFGLVKPCVDHKNRIHEEEAEYEIAHDFLIDRILTICNETMPTEVMGNIEYYSLNCQRRRDEEKSGYVSNTKYYDKFINKKSIFITNIFLYIFLAVLFVANLSYMFDFQNIDRDIKIICLITLNVGLSIYYIYNYYYWFMRVFKYSVLILLSGIGLTIAVYMNPALWAIFLGFEVFLIAIAMIFLCRQVRESEKGFFRTRISTIGGIGLVVILLGIAYRYCSQKEIQICLLLLYSAYISLGIGGHINQKYIYTLLGKFYKKGTIK